MEQRSATGGDHFVEDTYLAPQFGMLEFLRRLREDQLPVVVPEMFGPNLVSFNHLFLHGFLINKPEYIEHVLLTNYSNYGKSRFLRRVLGPLLGGGLLISVLVLGGQYDLHDLARLPNGLLAALRARVPTCSP